MKSAYLAAFFAAVSAAGVAQAGVTVTYENPGVQNSTASFTSVGVETFEGQTAGTSPASFATTFGGSSFTGTYSGVQGVQVDGANLYGSAGGVGNHVVAFSNNPFSLALDQKVTYFGFWLSALDAGNVVTLTNGGSTIFTFTPADVLAAINARPDRANFFGNPNPAFLGQDGGEPFVFVNFFSDTGFDGVRFTEACCGGYESDNHTVGIWTTKSGNGVPEPAAWALMLAGFGLAGATLRRSREVLAA